MPIIFGWGKQTTWNVGPVFRQRCSHCNNEEYWVLLRRTTWFSLFFIPIIPYKTQWWLLCPICKYGLELKPEQVKQLQPIAETNQLLATKRITEQEYQARMVALNSNPTATADTPSLPQVEAEVEAEAKTDTVYCSDCGKELMSDSRFCAHCGTKINQTVA